MASTRALISLPVDLKPNPLPYGRLSLAAGAWDQLRAQRAYQSGDEAPQTPPGIDKRV
ncbi:MAG: hypothetical protein ABWY18_19300 [Tardiphaga sp.]